jgi:Cd2+/Zn2+-exporting ATPase
MAIPASSLVGAHKAESTQPDTAAGERAWLARFRLPLLAVLAWLFTFSGLALDHLLDAPAALTLGAFALAYLAGGTLATWDALQHLLGRRVNVDLLMVLAAAGAAITNNWAEGAILLSLFSTSNALEEYSLDRTKNAVRALMNLEPETARVQRNDVLIEIPVAELTPGDTIVIQPGERIPADAVVLAGSSSVDQAAITGESLPIQKDPGDELFAGTINGRGSLHARVTKLAADSTLSRIVRLVAMAREDTSDMQEFAESFEGKYAVFVIAFSTLVTLVPMAFGADPYEAFYRGMTLLVVMSPCALVISTPAATLSALANAARKGILVKGGRALDLLGGVDTVAFDKTGTLTNGKPQLTDIVTLNGSDPARILACVAAAEALSGHPIGTAIVAAAQRDGLALPPAGNLEAHVGSGITAEVDGQLMAIGNERLFRDLGIEAPAAALEHFRRLGHEGKSTMMVGAGRDVVAVIGVADVIRPRVAETIRELKQQGVKRTVMLTGDNERVAAAIASSVGIDEVHADLFPEQKLDVIEEMKVSGKVAMIGDGVNDAPALATAHVGIAMGAAGTDVALETADVVLMSDDLSKVSYSIGLSRKMRRIIRINLGFALTVITILATSTLLVGIPLPLGVIGHEGSTILVVLNGLRLLGYGSSLGDILHRAQTTEQVPAEPRQYVVTAA